MKHAIALALTLASAGAALGGVADEKIEGYTDAPPADKLALISIAYADKVLNNKETAEAVAEVTKAEVDKGKDPKERLELLGALRAAGDSKLKELNKQRKQEKKRFASFREPESYFQQALALHYIAFATSAKPSLTQLGCLKLVRDCTSWTAHHPIVLATATEAFSRDHGFMQADLEGKLKIIKTNSEERAMLSDHERSYLEKSVLAEWLNARLNDGVAVDQIDKTVRDLKARKMICFFTSSWADGLLKRLTTFPKMAKSAPPAESGK